MTPTEKQKCIAEQAVYGDLQLNRRAYDDVEEKYIMEIVDSKWVLDFINYDKLLSLAPILRPLTDLTVEITHKGYNEDKPFVPLVELAKEQYEHLGYCDYRSTLAGYIGVVECSNEDGDKQIMSVSQTSSDGVFVLCHYQDAKDEPIEAAVPLFPIFDRLHLLHFDTRNLIEKGDAVDVNTLTINPYSVKL